MERKLPLILAIREQGEEVLARQVLEEQVELGLPGLGREVTDICYQIALQDICRVRPGRPGSPRRRSRSKYSTTTSST